MAKPASAVRLAIVGSESLLGRELRDLLSNQQLSSRVDLLSEGDENERVLSEQDGDPVLLAPLNKQALEGARVIFLSGSPASARRVAALKPNATLIDLTGSLEGGLLRAPEAEPERYLAPESRVVTIAHPAAILLSIFLRRLASEGPIQHALFHIFEPASQRGPKAIEELQQQTVSLLSFKPLPTAIFGEQLSFNMLPRLGEEAVEPLEETTRRIRRDLAALLHLQDTPPIPLPSFRLVHAPVFHSYTVSAWVQFKKPVDAAALLRLTPFELRSLDEGSPTNTGVAGQAGITVDAIVPDDESPNAAWYWLAADNIRLVASNALLAAASILEQSARRVQ